MAVQFEDNRLFCIEAPLSLSSGDETRLFKQFSKNLGASSCSDAGYRSDSVYKKVKWTTKAILPYKKVFSDYDYRTYNEKSFNVPYHHHVLATKTYGQFWEEGSTAVTSIIWGDNKSAVAHDFVEFIFHQEVYPLWVSVMELCNPGGVIRIWAKDSENQWHVLWSASPQRLPNRERVFSPRLENCNFKTKMLRLEFHCNHLDYYSCVSGIFLIGTSEFIVPGSEIENQNLGLLLEALGGPERDLNDPCNLTPNLRTRKLDRVILQIDKVFCEKYVLYKSENTAKQTDDKSRDTQRMDTVVLSGENRYGNPTHKNFDSLPDEVLLILMNYLDPMSIWRISQTNRRFERVAQNLRLYEDLNMKPYWHSVNDNFVNYLTTDWRNLRRLDLSWCGGDNAITPKVFNNFLQCCGNRLTDLRLDRCSFVEDSVLEQVSLLCPNLKELCLCECKATTDGLRSLKRFKTLERLDLSETRINDSTLCSIIQKNPLMRHLHLSKVRLIDMIAMARIISYSCPYLETIQCQHSSLNATAIRSLARCTRLRELDFAYACMENWGYAEGPCFACFSSLEKIVLTGFKDLGSLNLESLLTSSHAIQQLHLSGIAVFNVEICSRFLSSCPEIKVIDMSGCHQIKDTDVKNWQQLYPQVSFKWSLNDMYRTER